MTNIIDSVAEDIMVRARTEIEKVIDRIGLPALMMDEMIGTQAFIGPTISLREWLVKIFQGTWPEGDPASEEALRRDLEQYFFQHTYLSDVASSAGDYKQAMCSALFRDKADQKRMDEFIKMDVNSAVKEMRSRCEAVEDTSDFMRKMAEAIGKQRAKAMAEGMTQESRIKAIVEFMSPLICLAAIAMSRPNESRF